MITSSRIWRKTLTRSALLLALLPSLIHAASIASLDGTPCPVTDTRCSCSYRNPFHGVKCSSLSDSDDFRSVLANATGSVVLLELDRVDLDHPPLDDLLNSSMHTVIIGNSTFGSFQNVSSETQSGFENLHHLSLENVTFRQPLRWADLKPLQDLQVLFLHNTTVQDTALPAGFGAMVSKELMALAVAQSNLTSIEDGSLEGFAKLLTLRISHSEIQTFSRGALPAESKLEQIRLDHNKIHSLPDGTFDDLPQLMYVSLSNNSLSTIPQSVFGPLWNPKLRIDLRANPLKCDCRLLWTVTSESRPSSVVGYCSHPKLLFGKSIDSLTTDDLKC